jgi:hypothetical protein
VEIVGAGSGGAAELGRELFSDCTTPDAEVLSLSLSLSFSLSFSLSYSLSFLPSSLFFLSK